MWVCVWVCVCVSIELIDSGTVRPIAAKFGSKVQNMHRKLSINLLFIFYH